MYFYLTNSSIEINIYIYIIYNYTFLINIYIKKIYKKYLSSIPFENILIVLLHYYNTIIKKYPGVNPYD